MTLTNQLVSTAIISYVFATLGILYILPSSTLKLFSSENTPLNRVMTDTELSIMGSISSASTLIMMPFCGYLLDILGRKRCMILFFSPQLVAWVLLVTIYRVEVFISAMFLCGLSGSIFLIAPVYFNEIADSYIRGSLSSCPVIFHSVGLFISYCFGGALEYRTINYTGLSLAVVGLLLISLLKESPLFLLRKGLDEEAAKSIAFYKGLEPDDKEVLAEIKNTKMLLYSGAEIGGIPEMDRLKPEGVEKLSILKFLKKSRSTRRALTVVFILYTTSIFQGVTIVQIFAEPLFESAVPGIRASVSTIIFGITTVIASFAEAYLVERAGRRILLISSSVITGLFCVILGTQIQFQWGPHWLTAVCIHIYSIAYSIGPGPIPYVLIGEIFLPEIKSFATTVIIEWVYICLFLILFMYNPLFKAYGLGPLFHIFAGFSFFTAIFAFFNLPETKNLPVDVIQRKFLERKIY